MGTDYHVDVYVKRSDNTDFAEDYSELPNRYIPAIDHYWTGEDRNCVALGRIFTQLLQKKRGDESFASVKSYVRFQLEDFDFLFDKLAELPESDFLGNQYPMETILSILDEWKADYTHWSAEVEFYFFWC